MSHDVIQAGFDPDEDLFDFAGVVRDSGLPEQEEDLEEIFASFRDSTPAEELLAVPNAVAAAPTVRVTAPEPSTPASHVPSIKAVEPKSAPRPVTASPQPSGSHAAEPVHELVPAARPARFSKGVVAIALSVTVLNSVLAVVMVRGRASASDVRPTSEVVLDAHERDALAAPPHESTPSLPDPEGLDPAHAHPALDEARAQISRGEYSAARQHVYGLLAIIDRLEEPRRGALEADCQFLIAQSLHLEALARMGGNE